MDLNPEILKLVKKKVEALTETTEFRVREIFTNLGYWTSRYYYEDRDPSKNIDVIREVDIYATTSIEFKVKETSHNLFIYFIGDVKMREKYGERLILGLTMRKKRGQLGIREAYSEYSSFATLTTKGELRLLDSPIPVCSHLKVFKIKKKNSENTETTTNYILEEDISSSKNSDLRNYLMQISSAFHNLKNNRFIKEAEEVTPNSVSLILPILV